LRVLHVDTGTAWRGGQQQVLSLLDGSRDLGIVQVLLAPRGSPLASRARQAAIEVIDISPQALALDNLQTLRRLAHQFDLVHAHDSHAHTLVCTALPFASRSSLPLVVSRRVGFPISSLGRAKYRFPAMFIAISEFVRWRLLEAGVPAEKIHVVYDGVHAPAIIPRPSVRAESRRRHGADEKTFVLGTLSAIAPGKLLEKQVRLLANLPPSVHYWLGVPGGESNVDDAGAALLEVARRIGAEKRFQIVPVAQDPSAFLAGLDIFLYLSRMEGLGSAILLAMAYQLPVVASEVGGIPEIVFHCRTGVLVRKSFENELPGAIQFLIGAPHLRREMARAARLWVRAHATSDKMVAQTVVLYQKLLQESGGPGE